MRLDINDDNEAVSAELRNRAASRVFWTLCRYGERIGPVRVRLRRSVPATGGVESLCGIAVDLRPGGRVLARARAVDLEQAIDCAADRINHAVGERLAPPEPELTEGTRFESRARAR